MVKRLDVETRKKEILEAAMKVFLEKGFSKSTMEDIISKTTLSKGGVYHYYSNIHEIIVDLFLEGNRYRINKVENYIKENDISKENFNNVDFVADLLTEKIIDNNKYMPIYAMFLSEIKFNKKLEEIFNEIMNKSRQELFDFTKLDFFKEKNEENFIFITNILNTFIIGKNLLKIDDNFIKNKEIIKQMLKTALKFSDK